MGVSDISLAEAVKQLENYTSDEIALLLTFAGKTGERQNEESCPMANYFYDVVGNRCVVDNHSVYAISGGHSFALPGGVQRFIAKFDEGGYEDLEGRFDGDS